MNNANAIKAGDAVKYATPTSDSERAARFVVLEVRGDRLLVELIGDWPIRPTECYAATEYEIA